MKVFILMLLSGFIPALIVGVVFNGSELDVAVIYLLGFSISGFMQTGILK